MKILSLLIATICFGGLVGCQEVELTQPDSVDSPTFDKGPAPENTSSPAGSNICSLYSAGDLELPPLCVPYFFDKGRPPDTNQVQEKQEPIINPIPEVQVDNFS